jgi:transposase
MGAKPWDVPDDLWERLEPLLPRRQRRFRYPVRKPLDDRRVLQGILFVLHTGIGWEHLAQELGFGCGLPRGAGCATGRRRACGSVCTRCCWPSCRRPGRSTGRVRSPTPATCKRKRGVANGSQPGRQRRSRQQAPPPRRRRRHPAGLDADRRQSQRRHPAAGAARPRAARPWAVTGRPRHRPDTVVADRGYDHDKYRRLVWQRGIKPVIARRQTEHGSGLGRDRWVVERTFAWLHNRGRLLVRTDRRHETHESFLALACSHITWQRLQASSGVSGFLE